MSETPRTDAMVQADMYRGRGVPHDWSSLCRKLERDNAELRQSHAAIYQAIGGQEADLSKWPAMIRELREDKARIDWLEGVTVEHGARTIERQSYHRNVRQAIDAARKVNP